MTSPDSPPRRESVLPSGEPRPRYDLEKLLTVAVTVFSDRGYDGTSVEDLSRASGLSKSSMYHHIDSKEHLLRLSLERALEPLLAIMDEPNPPPGKALERLSHVIRRMVMILSEQLPYVTLLLRVHGNTPTERWALRKRRAFDAFVAYLVQEAVNEGQLRPDLDALTTARLIFGTINSLIEWHRPGFGPSADELAEQIVAMVFDGIRCPQPAP